MNRVLGILVLLIACKMPALPLVERMTADDEAKFNSYYSRWLETTG